MSLTGPDDNAARDPNPQRAKQIPEWRCAFSRLEGAYSPHTLRSYRCDFQAFVTWCNLSAHPALPSTPEIVSDFITCQAGHLANGTLKRRLAGIRKVHRLCGFSDPTDDEDVVIALRRAFRSRPSRPQQALGLTRELRDVLVASSDTDLRGLRNRALVAIAYDTLCRRSELVALRFEDIGESVRGKPMMFVRRAKNDQFGNGRTAAISTSGLKLLNEWLTAASITEGPLFRPIYHNTVVNRALNPFSVARVLKSMASTAGLDQETVRRLSGHSMRIGAAQDLMADGYGILTIMRAGGWKSLNVVARYVEYADLQIWD